MRLDPWVLWVLLSGTVAACSETTQDQLARALVELVGVLVLLLREWQWSLRLHREQTANERLEGQVATLSMRPPAVVIGGLGAEPPVIARASDSEPVTVALDARREREESPPTPQPHRRPSRKL